MKDFKWDWEQQNNQNIINETEERMGRHHYLFMQDFEFFTFSHDWMLTELIYSFIYGQNLLDS
jgi:hypothetical protein